MIVHGIYRLKRVIQSLVLSGENPQCNLRAGLRRFRPRRGEERSFPCERRAYCMAVYGLFRNKAFEPETIATMTSAYADVCRALGVDDDRPEADAVAKKVIEFAQRGERDPVRLRNHVLQAFQR